MISTRTPITADTLNSVVEFDSPFTVHPADADGNVTISRADGVYAPDVYDVVKPDDFHSDTWELVNGYSGQDRYAGPIMHDSEFLGGGMARDVLATPGTYVVVAAYYNCTDEEHADGRPVTDDDPRDTFTDASGVTHTYVRHDDCETYADGWALARLREELREALDADDDDRCTAHYRTAWQCERPAGHDDQHTSAGRTWV